MGGAVVFKGTCQCFFGCFMCQCGPKGFVRGAFAKAPAWQRRVKLGRMQLVFLVMFDI